MASVFVIHADSEVEFLQKTLLPLLPSLGVDFWASSAHPRFSPDVQLADAMHEHDAVVVIVSRSLADEESKREEVRLALSTGRALIPIRFDETPPARIARGLGDRAEIDAESARLWHELAAVLPSIEPFRTAPTAAILIDWDSAVFSRSLTELVEQFDFERTSDLVRTLERSVAGHSMPYPTSHARADLKLLRRKRQFELMRGYAEAVIRSGTNDAQVRRQLGQALIELGRFADAMELLESLASDPSTPLVENQEARGLIGRACKQRYVNAPRQFDAWNFLWKAISAYRSVYDEDRNQLWHGVNVASCLLRGHRDGVEGCDPRAARDIARDIVRRVDARTVDGVVTVWDHASRIEALLACGEYDAAGENLSAYLSHPELDAFEVSSTYRQFDQLLELGSDRIGAALLMRLWDAVRRYRTHGIDPPPSVSGADVAVEAMASTATASHVIIRVTNPAWQPKGVPDLVVHARSGGIVSAEATEASMRVLCQDPDVLSIEESRRASESQECVNSVPFVRVARNYPDRSGAYEEHGDRALVAIIDDGIDVLHRAFLDDGGASRIFGIWNQVEQSDVPQPGFGFGRFHSQADIAEYVSTRSVPAALGRNDAAGGHGTHVASIAAGRPVGEFAGGIARHARLLVVVSAAGEAIGYSRAHVEALAFIDSVATEMGMPVVVNVSQGMNSGAHDGNSALEAAFDAFSGGGRRPGRVIVKSAGNERGKSGHAEVQVGQSGKERLEWRPHPESNSSFDRLELWWSSANELRFRLSNDEGFATDWYDRSHEGAMQKDGVTMEFTSRHVDNGDSLLVVKVANTAFPTRTNWTLEIEGVSVEDECVVQAWIERAGRFPTMFSTHANEAMTLSVPGTARHVIAVGAVKSALPIQVGDFSSYGPTRDNREKPELAAPGVEIQAARAATIEGVTGMSGTSMAAPHVTGAIALLLSRKAKSGGPIPTSSQIAAVLRQKSHSSNGRWHRGRGFGVLDVEALLAAF